MEWLLRDGVSQWCYAAALRPVLRLATPGVLLLLPTGVVASLGVIPLAGDALVVVDGRPKLAGAASVPLGVWGAAALVAWTTGQVVVFPATVVLAAWGRLMIAWSDGTGDLHEGNWQLMLAAVLCPCRSALPRPHLSQPVASAAPTPSRPPASGAPS
ncbi:hypothetical protein ACQP2T_27100 [Nonomuraea sp. CA-143628]|uniref:hypothetical protein n=1 Tax=Nonomuraea sp. CA-143628 TaxID=3239997 RepID=UPI003D8E8CFB